MKNKFKLILIAVFVVGVIGTVCYFLLLPKQNRGEPVATLSDPLFGWKFPANLPLISELPPRIGGKNLFDFEIAYSTLRDPGGIPQGLPVRLKVPIIGVSSAIEDALITPDGRMDVPAGSVNVAWFALGPNPGRVGSAVIGGHYGIKNGVPMVFYNLNKLVVGDKVYIENDKGETLTFQVRRIQLFDRDADATTVFTSKDGLAHLNLITCEGIWNRINNAYPSRRVVFTDLIPTEGIAPAGVVLPGVVTTVTPIILKFNQTLRIGSRGADVLVLQNALKLIGISSGVADGIFGGGTSTAVARYQSSAGLLPDGVFGPSTRTKLALELAADTNANLPNAGTSLKSVPPTLDSVSPTLVSTEKIPTQNSVENLPSSSQTTPQTNVSSLKSLYATPTDGLITSILLISIIFIVFKIIL